MRRSTMRNASKIDTGTLRMMRLIGSRLRVREATTEREEVRHPGLAMLALAALPLAPS